MRFLWVFLAATIPGACQAVESDVEIGRYWARCSQQAEILRTLNADHHKDDVLRKSKAKLNIYAISAAGQEIVDLERKNTERDFYSGVSSDKTRTAIHIKSFYQIAENDAKKCILLMEKNEARFKAKVHEIIARNKHEKNRPPNVK